MTKIKSLEERTMTIQKKSLINSLNTTKKAIVASTPATGTAASGTVKPALSVRPGLKAGTRMKAGLKAGTRMKAGLKAGTRMKAGLKAGRAF
jgi:hypothetical protein